MRCVLTIVLLLSLFSIALAVKPKQAKPEVSRAARRPDLAGQLSEVASLKIVSRKSTYRIDEMIRFDIALMNRSNEPIYLRDLSWVSLEMRHAQSGEIQRISQHLVTHRFVSAESFEIVAPKDFVMSSRDLLARCDDRAFEQWNFVLASADEADGRVFDQNKFITFGSGCFTDGAPGKYEIVARLKNEHVVMAQKHRETAVGTLVSQPLTLTIVE